MKKFGLALAAAAAITFVAPTLASAETTVIKKVYKSGARAEMHHDRGMHRGWGPRHRHADRVVIIKKRGHHHHY